MAHIFLVQDKGDAYVGGRLPGVPGTCRPSSGHAIRAVSDQDKDVYEPAVVLRGRLRQVSYLRRSAYAGCSATTACRWDRWDRRLVYGELASTWREQLL